MKEIKKFNFFIPISSLQKAKDANGNEIMKVGGIASTSSKDLEGEEIIPDGMDLSYFRKSGFFNYDHKSKDNPAAIIGEPTIANIKNNKLHVEGFLYPESKMARDTYALIQTLEKSSGSRRMGFSIEGNAVERGGLNSKKVTKSRITGIAITPNPINTQTLVNVLKGFNKGEISYIEPEFEVKENDCSGGKCILDITEGNERIIVDTDFNIIRKSIEPDIIKENVSMNDKDFLGDLITEHEKLIKLLREGTSEAQKEEAEHQVKELETYKKKHSELSKTLNTVSGAAVVREDVEGAPKKLVNKDCIEKAIVIIANAINKGILPKTEKTLVKNKLSQ